MKQCTCQNAQVELFRVPNTDEVCFLLFSYEMFKSGKRANVVAEEQGLTQINDLTFLGAAVEQIIQGNPRAVQDFLGGKEGAIRFLIGQVMKETRGRANPATISEILREHLSPQKVDGQ